MIVSYPHVETCRNKLTYSIGYILNYLGHSDQINCVTEKKCIKLDHSIGEITKY